MFSTFIGDRSSNDSGNKLGGVSSDSSARGGDKGARKSSSSSSSSSTGSKDKRGAMQALGPAGEGFVAGVSAFQERLLSQNNDTTAFIFGDGVMANFSVPWKGLGIYAGGVVSGLAITVGLLTVPYADLGSPGLRKSLTLFENVLVDIDQVRYGGGGGGG